VSRIIEETIELVRPVLATRVELLIEQLWKDEEVWQEIRERFEHGSLCELYPAIHEGLSRIPDEEKDAFLKAFAIEAMRCLAPPDKQSCDESPFYSNDWYRGELYEGMAYLYHDELREFAQEWLQELDRVGYRGMTTVRHKDGKYYRLPAKEQADRLRDSPISRPLSTSEEAYPIPFEDTCQVMWLQLRGERSLKRGYREARVSATPVRTDMAILAALTTMEGRRVADPERLREALEQSNLTLDESLYMQSSKSEERLPDWRAVGHPVFLDYVLLLLRHYRPGFSSLPQAEKASLVSQTCAHIDQFLEALRKLAAFLEYGTPDGRQKAATVDADRDVRAAVRRDVDELTYREIGKELGIPPPKDLAYKGDHPRVRQMVGRGRKILERALGAEGWQEHTEAMKAEAERWRALSEAEQEAEDSVEHLGLPYEEALRRAEEEVAKRRQRRAQPENH